MNPMMPASVTKMSIGHILSISDATEYALIAHPTPNGYAQIAERIITAVEKDLNRDSGAGGFLRACGCIRIDRNNVTMSTMREITAKLKSGEVVSMFPQGRISEEDKAEAGFKSGMTLMAIRSGAPIIPAYIKPRKSFFSRLKVVIGERVSVTELYGERPTFAEIDAATKLLSEREKQLKDLAE